MVYCITVRVKSAATQIFRILGDNYSTTKPQSQQTLGLFFAVGRDFFAAVILFSNKMIQSFYLTQQCCAANHWICRNSSWYGISAHALREPAGEARCIKTFSRFLLEISISPGSPAPGRRPGPPRREARSRTRSCSTGRPHPWRIPRSGGRRRRDRA